MYTINILNHEKCRVNIQSTIIILIIGIPTILSFTNIINGKRFHKQSAVGISKRENTLDDTFFDDNRPHEQRRKSPRKARRLNHPFQHLYRHDTFDLRYHSSEYDVLSSIDDDDETNNIQSQNTTEYLLNYGGYTTTELITLSQTFPPLLNLSVTRHLKPKLRFLKYTLHGSNQNLDSNRRKEEDSMNEPLLLSQIGKSISPSFYGARLEHAIAPRHAFLTFISNQYQGNNVNDENDSSSTNSNQQGIRVLFGKQLLQNPEKMRDFLHCAGRSSRQFAAMCNRWNGIGERETLKNTMKRITSKQIEEFEQLFRRGLLSAARNEWKASSSINDNFNVKPSQMISLLVSHGANVMERDTRGVSLLHWAAGSGNIKGYQVLEQLMIDSHIQLNNENKQTLFQNLYESNVIRAERDGATPLHWAVAGAKPKEFGCGGHVKMCAYILEMARKRSTQPDSLRDDISIDTSSNDDDRKDDHDHNSNLETVVNAVTKDGNSVLMWASWAGSLDIVQLLISNGANTHQTNRNGCTVAHWAASGGNLKTCKYLLEECKVEFAGVQNHAGNTPLSHAVAYSRLDVVRWLKNDIGAVEVEGLVAMDLAKDFVTWEDAITVQNKNSYETSERKAILDIFTKNL